MLAATLASSGIISRASFIILYVSLFSDESILSATLILLHESDAKNITENIAITDAFFIFTTSSHSFILQIAAYISIHPLPNTYWNPILCA